VIIEWLLSLMAGAWEGLCAALPAVPVPAWVSAGSGSVASVLGMAAQLGNWIPLELFGVVVLAVVACLLAGLAIKVTRIVASFVTLGGGGAG